MKINELYNSKCSNIPAVFDLLLSFPAGTSECKRVLSQMAIMKSKYRNRLHSTTMTMLMTVDLHSSDIADFDLKHKGRRKPIMLIFSYNIEIESLIYLIIGLK